MSDIITVADLREALKGHKGTDYVNIEVPGYTFVAGLTTDASAHLFSDGCLTLAVRPYRAEYEQGALK